MWMDNTYFTGFHKPFSINSQLPQTKVKVISILKIPKEGSMKNILKIYQ